MITLMVFLVWMSGACVVIACIAHRFGYLLLVELRFALLSWAAVAIIVLVLIVENENTVIWTAKDKGGEK